MAPEHNKICVSKIENKVIYKLIFNLIISLSSAFMLTRNNTIF